MTDSKQNSDRLTKRQTEILEYIRQEVQLRGFPPSIREIGEHVGLSSSSTVHSHLRTLEEKNYIRRNPSKPRSIEVVDWTADSGDKVVPLPIRSAQADAAQRQISLPLTLAHDTSSFLFHVNSEHFKDEAIVPGDLVIVSPTQSVQEGDIILARANDLAPAELQKKSPSTTQENVLGKVVGVIRKM